MMFMVIERFGADGMAEAYARLEAEGRGLPDGLRYLGSWVDAGCARCFQLMECDDARLIQEWIVRWQGIGMSFEVVPVVPGRETQEVFRGFAEGA